MALNTATAGTAGATLADKMTYGSRVDVARAGQMLVLAKDKELLQVAAIALDGQRAEPARRLQVTQALLAGFVQGHIRPLTAEADSD